MRHGPPVPGRPTGARPWRRAVVVPVVVGLAALAALAACGPAVPVATGRALPVAPFDSSSATADGTWAVVPMGHLDDPDNTFWQLFFRPGSGGSWSLVTPPGVADNGGLVMTTGMQPTATVGFEPSQDLLFSPLARTTDDGRTWSPGQESAALAPDPDALAASPTGRPVALVRAAGGRVLAAASGTGAWRTIVTRNALARTAAGRSCGIGPLTAVTVAGPGDVVIGAACTRHGAVGVFADSGGGWRLVGPSLPRRFHAVTTRVLRLVTTSSGVSLVLGFGTGRTAGIVAAWSAAGQGAWTVSGTLVDARSGPIRSIGVGAGGDVVEIGAPHGPARLAAIAGPGAAWRDLSPPPAGTETVVARTDGAVDALAVRNSRVTDWVLANPDGSWSKDQTIKVPIDYGSSS